MNIELNDSAVLVINRVWQPVNTRTVRMALCMLFADVATALDITLPNGFEPIKWDVWKTLPVRKGDSSVCSVAGPVRVPRVIVLSSYDRMRTYEPALNADSVWDRDKGRCQWTNKPLTRAEANLDHVIPRDLGGQTTWENIVLSSIPFNSWKANRHPAALGIKPIRPPAPPKAVPIATKISNPFGFPEWDVFLRPYRREDRLAA